jgi:hypothetical protein
MKKRILLKLSFAFCDSSAQSDQIKWSPLNTNMYQDCTRAFMLKLSDIVQA